MRLVRSIFLLAAFAALPLAAAEEAPFQRLDPAAAAPAEVGWMASTVATLAEGGGTMLLLALLSVLGVTFILERLWSLRASRLAPVALLARADQLWREGKHDEIAKLAAGDRSLAAAVIAYLVRYRRRGHAALSAGAGEIASRGLRRHLQRAYPLAVVATLAPLCGLMGTVLGIIESFKVIAVTGQLGDAVGLAGGISKALVVTAAGLLVAIPALGFYHLFRTRTNLLAITVEERLGGLIDGWFADEGADHARAA